jgi:hypothetical protein
MLTKAAPQGPVTYKKNTDPEACTNRVKISVTLVDN